jgi:hypothetical protein
VVLLLARPMFSILDATTEFCRREPKEAVQDLPLRVQDEVIVASLVAVAWCRPRNRLVAFRVATDAAPEFGFGVCVCRCGATDAREVGRLAERRGDYVRLFWNCEGPGYKDRLGTLHVLPFRQPHFCTVVCKKARWKAHSEFLEAHGLLLGVKWALRKSSHHGHRLAILGDAKAILGAAAKGRSSARARRPILRQVGALTMCSNNLLLLVYIPVRATLQMFLRVGFVLDLCMPSV